jgi:hypothetical protein
VYCCVVLDVFSRPGGGLVDRQPPGYPAGHQRPGHGHHQPHADPLNEQLLSIQQGGVATTP